MRLEAREKHENGHENGDATSIEVM
jgi:hypothetical protein